MRSEQMLCALIFQSTLPVWGATLSFFSFLKRVAFQSTLPVWGATVIPYLDTLAIPEISIHAPRVGSDVNPFAFSCFFFAISIHAPRVGSDDADSADLTHITGISIHAPRVGSDPYLDTLATPANTFQSTLPVWGATLPACTVYRKGAISIHAPRVGSDSCVR